MSYKSELKARVPAKWAKEVETEADKEGLKVSDIVRRAIRKYLGKRADLQKVAS